LKAKKLLNARAKNQSRSRTGGNRVLNRPVRRPRHEYERSGGKAADDRAARSES